MPQAEASVDVDAAERYAEQLCHHASRMGAAANWTPPVGVIEFPQGGTCRITADGTSLSLTADASTLDQLGTIETIVGADLQRFSRSGIRLTWTGDQAPRPESQPGHRFGAHRNVDHTERNPRPQPHDHPPTVTP